jgi:tellurite resistance protein TerC
MRWVFFNLFVLVMLALDLGVFHKNAHAIKVKEALTWTVVWITLALIFCAGVHHFRGKEVALQFLTGYLIEKSLSVDNIFIFILIFTHFKVPALYQHKVLFWGVLGALVMRAILIIVGAALMERFHWIMYLFGGFLIFTGIRMAVEKEKEMDLDQHSMIRLARKFYPVHSSYEGDHFFMVKEGRKHATLLFLVLLIVEFTDLIFALDSIPAIFAITTDSFIVYTSNVFAILGLRSLYFALAGVMNKFHYLKIGLSVILSFVGVKMVIADFYHIPVVLSLGVIAAVLAVSMGISLIRPPVPKREV